MMDMMNNNAQGRLILVCDEIKRLLLAKNKAYGESAQNPIRVFSSLSPIEALKVRADDKLARLMNGSELPDESRRDTLMDLAGYIVLLIDAYDREKEVKT